MPAREFLRSRNSIRYALSIVVVILVVVFGITIEQILAYGKYADKTKKDFDTYITIKKIFDNLNEIEKEQFTSSLLGTERNTEEWTAKLNANLLQISNLQYQFINNKKQLQRLNELDELHIELIDNLALFNIKDSLPIAVNIKLQKALQEIYVINQELKELENEFIETEINLINANATNLKLQSNQTTIIFILATILALIIFLITIYKVFSDRLKIKQTTSFLESVLIATNDIVNLYTPLYNEKGNVYDFKIEYASIENKKITNYPVSEIIGKNVSDVFPYLKEAGRFSDLIVNFNKKIEIDEITKIKTKGKNRFLRTRYFPSEDDLKVVISDVTEAVENTKRLERLNKELTKTTSYLEYILDNTPDLYNLYSPIKNEKGEVIDFSIEYASKSNTNFTTTQQASEIVGKKVSEVFPFLVAHNKMDRVIKAYTTQQNDEYTWLLTREGFPSVYLRTRLFPTKNYIQIIVTEVTDLVLASEQIKTTNSELELSNEVLIEAEKIAKMGSYVWYMEEDKIYLSDNIFDMLGYKTKSKHFSSKDFIEFVYEEDIDLYENNVLKAYTEYKSVDFIFRIINKEGKIKHLYNKGVFSKRDGQTIMIGVIQDVSNQVANENKLKEQNIELIRRNAELDSFNRIASHDLQEPLRKVQMFISRLEDAENDNLSKRGKNYLDRVHQAASRMRTLINNLLAFSRIDKKETVFEEVDLKEVVDDVKANLTVAINEANATIKTDNLPTVDGIPFQLEQLFNNLIGNSIKYKQKEVNPIISITCTKMHQRQIVQKFTKTHAYYYQIKVVDNGIGFDSENNKKIFDMFQRLHAKHEYSGTGIGLAICKKIVQKHHGYIYATSVKGSGSAFIFYLPVGTIKSIPKLF